MCKSQETAREMDPLTHADLVISRIRHSFFGHARVSRCPSLFLFPKCDFRYSRASFSLPSKFKVPCLDLGCVLINEDSSCAGCVSAMDSYRWNASRVREVETLGCEHYVPIVIKKKNRLRGKFDRFSGVPATLSIWRRSFTSFYSSHARQGQIIELNFIVFRGISSSRLLRLLLSSSSKRAAKSADEL